MASPIEGARELVRRAWASRQQRRERPGFHSRFGGLWTDRRDAARLLEERLQRGTVSRADAGRLAFWMEHGFWIEKGAVPHDVVARVRTELAALASDRAPPPLVELGGSYQRLAPELAREHVKLVDAYALSRAALEAAFSPSIRAFLQLLFEDEALLFQSLSFERGSEQPVHQDTAYVVVSPPLAFAAAWIALEDVRAGSGELVYYPGSHRLPDHLFGGEQKNWNRERHGLAEQERFHRELLARCAAHGLAPATFLPARGDVLFWSADLAHGGTPIRDARLTRASLVCHYCPGSAMPYYFHHRPERRAAREHAPGARYASSHYDLARPC
jgi:hypothetical protein